MAENGPLLGAELELRIGAVAQGGACVARHDGRVVFVRHTLPGELVRARVVEDRGGSFCRADAVEILQASPDRVQAPCQYAGPGRCGGCDWQHVDAAAQREFKSAVVREQFSRLAGIDVDPLFRGVEELPGGLLGWRTRNLYALDRSGRFGLRKHGSHDVVPIERCVLGAANVSEPPVLDDDHSGLTAVEVAGSTDVDVRDVALLGHRPGPGRQARGRRPPDRVELIAGPATLQHRAFGRDFEVDAAGFWQVHPEALDAFGTAVLDMVAARPGETVLDLYAGAGPLTAALAVVVGPTGEVVGMESARQAVADSVGNLEDLLHAEVRQGRVTAQSLAGLDLRPDIVVLDPPRAGAGREVMAAILELAPRTIGYVGCDPAALARDVAVAAAAGWRLTALRAFDAFPMTHHVECVARLDPPSSGWGT